MISGDVHAQQSIYALEHRRNEVYVGLRRIVDSELLVIDAEPDPEWRRQAKMIMTYSDFELDLTTCGG